MNAEKTVNINDVAELAGVSNATVSRVLNGSDSVTKKTRKKVLQAIEDSGYIPNELARGLKTKSNKTIAVLISDILNGYYAEMTSYLEPAVREKGYALQLCITGFSEESIRENIENLLSRRVAGIIILSLKIESEVLIRRMKNNTCVVSIEGDIKDVDLVMTENKKGLYMSVENLINQGHKKIGFVGYQFDYVNLGKRLEGYKQALSDHDIPCREEYIVDGTHETKPGSEGVLRLMQLPDPPTAIQCMNEYCAQSVYLSLMENGYRIPEDISVAAFDGLKNMRLLYPRLTTVAIPMEEMARAAVDALMDKIEGNGSVLTKTITLPTVLQEGNSIKRI